MENENIQQQEDGGVLVQEAKPQVKKPSMYQVVMFNDDYTPMDFVVAALQKFFYMDRAKAVKVMNDIHLSGKGICGIYTRDIAETKVDLVTEYARSHDHPLLCNMELV